MSSEAKLDTSHDSAGAWIDQYKRPARAAAPPTISYPAWIHGKAASGLAEKTFRIANSREGTTRLTCWGATR